MRMNSGAMQYPRQWYLYRHYKWVRCLSGSPRKPGDLLYDPTRLIATTTKELGHLFEEQINSQYSEGTLPDLDSLQFLFKVFSAHYHAKQTESVPQADSGI